MLNLCSFADGLVGVVLYVFRHGPRKGITVAFVNVDHPSWGGQRVIRILEDLGVVLFLDTLSNKIGQIWDMLSYCVCIRRVEGKKEGQGVCFAFNLVELFRLRCLGRAIAE